MVVVDGQGIPIGAQLASAQLAECRLAESTLAAVRVPHAGRGRPRSHIKRIIADRGYDSDTLRMRFHKRGTDLIVPYRKNIRNRRFEDKRKLRRFRKRWKIERTNAWLQNFRRIQVRYDRILTVFQSFFSLRLLDYRLAAFMQPVLGTCWNRHLLCAIRATGSCNRHAWR